MLRLLDMASALPFLLIVILLLTLFERSLWLLLVAIGGYVWIDLARVMRAEAARLRETPFMLAATAMGASFGQRLRWHALPNLMPLAMVYLGLILPQAILVESFLGFLGLRLDEPSASWGTLLSEGVQELDRRALDAAVPGRLPGRDAGGVPVPRRQPARLAGRAQRRARRSRAGCGMSLALRQLQVHAGTRRLLGPLDLELAPAAAWAWSARAAAARA